MLLPPEVAAVIQEIIKGEPGCHNDLRLLRSERSYARLGLTALTLRPACVLRRLLVKKKEDRRVNALFAPPPPVGLLSGDGPSRLEDDASGLVNGEVSWPAPRVCRCRRLFTGCVSLSGEIRHFFFWPVVSKKYVKMTEIEGTKISSSQTLWPMCWSLPVGFPWSLYFRSVRQSDTVEPTATSAL